MLDMSLLAVDVDSAYRPLVTVVVQWRYGVTVKGSGQSLKQRDRVVHGHGEKADEFPENTYGNDL